ncbi:hypothetical protein BKA70DRAFT_1440594 [Coprinopsis sp. MPI-PUGE-AT-0042]|nr:hypothetical protein BKA70DRAFT_1440594 [Coprinopsis sp. MPI-PUGE-AT-0042]
MALLVPEIPGVGPVQLQYPTLQPPYPSVNAGYHPGLPPYTIPPTSIPYPMPSYAASPGVSGLIPSNFPGTFAPPSHGAQPFLGVPGSLSYPGPAYTSTQTLSASNAAPLLHYTQPMQPPMQPMQLPMQPMLPPMQPPRQPTEAGASAPPSDLVNGLRARQEAERNTKDQYDWPQGDQRREARDGDEPKGWNESKWVWRSSGTRSDAGVSYEKRFCLGVHECESCTACEGMLKMPINTSASRLQGVATQGFFMHHGQQWRYWQHEGEHQHIRPPERSAKQSDKQLIDCEVACKPGASAHELRTGSLDDDSIPLSAINPALADPRKTRYAVAQSKVRQNITTSKLTGGFEFLSSFKQLKSELGEAFVVAGQLHGPSFMVFQTAFMRKMAEQSVVDWVSMDDRVHHRHGFVTDGSHSFFQQGSGVLLATCVFSAELRAWVPVLYTWIEGLDAEHHRAHFKHLFATVVEKVSRDGLRFDKRFLLNVMDFSDAQRKAHEEEYAAAAAQISIPGFDGLCTDAKEAQLKALRAEALSAEAGCHIHFWRHAERVEGTSDLVPAARRAEFRGLLYRMVASKTSEDDFDATVSQISRDFPDAFGWLSWWLRPSHVGMIFPAKSSVDPTTADEIPKTSNPIECSHFLLNHAGGSHNDFLPGIKKMFGHVKEIERQFDAVIAGHYTPSGPREYRAPKKVRFDANDGRGPDTAEAIRGLQPSNVKGHGLYLVAYQWSKPNSCFFDNGIELLFRCYWLWPIPQRTALRSLLPTDCYLASLISHFDRRITFIAKYKKPDVATLDVYTQDLKIMQTTTRSKIFDTWLPALDRNAFHGASCWIDSAIKACFLYVCLHNPELTQTFQDGGTCLDVVGFFGIRRQIEFECQSSHVTTAWVSTTVPAITQLPEITDWTDMLFEKLGHHPTVGDHLFNEVLFAPNMELIPVLTSEQRCSHPGCTLVTLPQRIQRYWPQMLSVRSTLARGLNAAADKTNFDVEFSIPSGSGDSAETVYTCVGRILHDNDHFTSQLYLDGNYYNYDDQKGKLTKARKLKGGVLSKRTVKEVYYTYYLTSGPKMGIQSMEAMLENYTLFHSSNPTGTPRNPVTIPDEGPKAGPSRVKRAPPELPGSGSDSESLPDNPLEGLLSKVPVQKRAALLLHQPSQHQIPLPPTCTSCGVTGPASEETIRCHLCLSKWHVVCIQALLPPGHDPKDADFEELHWCCSQCLFLNHGKWDQLMIGKFITLNASQAQRDEVYFPAKILSRNGAEVTLRWHPYNVWKAKQRAMPPDFVRTPQECYTAFTRIRYPYNAELGGILWPIELIDSGLKEPSDSELEAIVGRDENGIVPALKDALPAIIELLTGGREHPIVDLIKNWMEPVKTVKGKTPALTRASRLIAFRESFSLPIIPGHTFLIEMALGTVSQAKHNAAPANDHVFNNAEGDMEEMCASILLHLVVIRQYFGLQPDDDGELFALSRVPSSTEYAKAKHEGGALLGRLRRMLTEHEKAFRSGTACVEDDLEGIELPADWTTVPHIPTLPQHMFKGDDPHLRRDVDSTLMIPNPRKLLAAYAADGSPYVFGFGDPYSHPFHTDLTESSCRHSRISKDGSPVPAVARPFPLGNSITHTDNQPPASPAPSNHPSEGVAATQTGYRIVIPPRHPRPLTQQSTTGVADTSAPMTDRQPAGISEGALKQTTLPFTPVPAEGRSLRGGTMAQRRAHIPDIKPKASRKRKREQD